MFMIARGSSLLLHSYSYSETGRSRRSKEICKNKNSSGEIAALLFQDDITPHMTRDLVKKLKPIVRVNAPTIVQL